MTIRVFIKKYYKLILCVCILVFIGVFLLVQKKYNLTDGNLNDWQTASLEKRDETVAALAEQGSDVAVVRECVDKLAILQDANKLTVKDAVKLCDIGSRLKKHI